jgi:hypothetical protein
MLRCAYLCARRLRRELFQTRYNPQAFSNNAKQPTRSVYYVLAMPTVARSGRPGIPHRLYRIPAVHFKKDFDPFSPSRSALQPTNFPCCRYSIGDKDQT